MAVGGERNERKSEEEGKTLKGERRMGNYGVVAA
jgi:hypothetical protein